MPLPARVPTTVNAQIVDAVSTTNATVIGEAPGFAMGTVYQAAAQSASRMMQNNASAQQSLQQVNVAVVSTAVAYLISIATQPKPSAPSGSSSSSGSGGALPSSHSGS